MVWRMYRQMYAGDERMIYLQARDITIESEPNVVTETDGEPLGETPLTVRAVPGGIHVLVPR
jgi:diacylglycerol kinase family enzyme